MARPKKPNKDVNVRLDLNIYKRLEKYCQEFGNTKTMAIERALEMYIDDYDRKKMIINDVEKK